MRICFYYILSVLYLNCYPAHARPPAAQLVTMSSVQPALRFELTAQRKRGNLMV